MTMIFKFDGIMKKYLFSAIAISAMAFTACTEQPINPVEPNQETVTINFISGNELDATKTYIDADNNVFWNASGEYLKIFETIDSQTKAVESKAGVVSEDGTTASFSAEFTPNTEGTSYAYNAVYPASSWNIINQTDNTNVSNLKVATPETQNPTLSSFDPAADLLIAKPISLTEQPSASDNLTLKFARAIAVGKLQITDLPDGQVVTSIQITTSDAALTGRSYVNLTDGEVTKYGYSGNANDKVTLNYDPSLNFVNNCTAIFTCFPCEIKNFTVIVTTADKKYTKTCSVPEGKDPLAFKVGKSTKFSVSMTGAATETIETFVPGEYVIVAKYNNVYYALSSEAEESNTPRLNCPVLTDFTSGTSIYSTTNNNIIWAIQQTEKPSQYYIKSIVPNVGYLAYTDNSANSAKTSDTPYALTISSHENNDGTYIIKSVSYPSRILSKNNSTTAGFAFYGNSNQEENLYIVPVGEDTRTPLATPSNVKAELVSEKLNSIKLDWDANTAAASYVVTYRYDTTSETKTVTTNTLTLDGLMYGKDYYFSVVAVPADAKANKESAASDEVKCTTGAAPTLSGEGTYDSPYSVNDIFTLGTGTESNVYVKGTISQIDEVNTKYGNATYYISNDGTTTDQLKVYRGKYLNGEAFTAEGQIAVGDVVVVMGDVSLYQDALQISANSQIVSLIREGAVPELIVDETPLNFAAAGESKTVTVTALNTEEAVSVTCDNTHFSVTGPVDGKYTITAPANETADQITSTLTISVAGLTKTVSLTQEGKVAGESSVTISFAGGSNKNLDPISFNDAVSEVSAVFTAGTHSTKPRWDASCVRFYGTASVSNNLTISCPEGKTITKIVFTMNGSYTMNAVSANSGTLDTTSFTWTGSSESVEFTSTAQTRFEGVTVTYTE